MALRQDSAHELNQHQIYTVCNPCIAAEDAGRYASLKDKSVVDVEELDVMNTNDSLVYWYWLDVVDIKVSVPKSKWAKSPSLT